LRNFLKEIIKYKKKKIEDSKKILPEERIKRSIKPLRAFPFKRAITKEGLNLIAEIKKASPSKGLICKDFNPLKIALDYKRAKVSALSVLTEERFFLGDINYISLIKKKIDLPILRKDFILDRYQIFESLYFGADSILLIAKILSLKKIKEFLRISKDIGLDCVLEINDKADLEKALKTDADIIGINNRNLNSFEVDLKTTERLFPLIPKDRIVISESGIKTRSEIEFLRDLGVKAVLIGEALLKAEDIPKKIKELGF
jgi:indole-3-glycerol phosphate synthase